MNYSVIILPRAEFDFQRLYDYIKKRSKRGADSWVNTFHRSLKRLHKQPDALELAPESEDHAEDIRQLLFKTGQGLIYRALFVIRDDIVFIIHIRGPGQDVISPDDLRLPD
ncbi:MAG: type II toxin-antitoxin system RelE/ParE family toxin [Pirellulaceae bacterium]